MTHRGGGADGAVPVGPQGSPSESMVVRLPAGAAPVPVDRTAAHRPPGLLHLAVSVQVVDPSGQRWLLQRRAAGKALFANRWANTCCTHPAPGVEPVVAARRRLWEETGLLVGDLVPAGSFVYRAEDPRSGLVEHEHDIVLAAVADVERAEPNPDEISELALLPFDQALDLLRSEAGVPWAPTILCRSYAALSRVRPQGGGKPGPLDDHNGRPPAGPPEGPAQIRDGRG